MKISKLIEFKNWADEVYLEYIKELSDEQFKKKILNKSIKDILWHIYEVYWGWFRQMTTGDYSDEPNFEELEKDDLISGIMDINSQMLEYAISGDLSKPVHIKWSKGDKEVTTNPENILFNGVNHSSYHRGQIAIMLRQLDLKEIKETDYNPYIYEMGQK